MTDKQIIIDGVDISGCEKQGETIAGITCGNGERIRLANEIITKHKLCKDNPNCVYKQLKRKEQECEALQMSENEAGEIIAELTAYKDVNEDFKTAWEELKAENEELKKIINEAKSSSLDLQSFLVGEAVQNEYKQQLDQLKAENEELIRRITKIFACLINANRTNKIVDTLWVDNITTLCDYIAQTLGIECDQVHIEEQILQKISECEVEND